MLCGDIKDIRKATNTPKKVSRISAGSFNSFHEAPATAVLASPVTPDPSAPGTVRIFTEILLPFFKLMMRFRVPILIASIMDAQLQPRYKVFRNFLSEWASPFPAGLKLGPAIALRHSRMDLEQRHIIKFLGIIGLKFGEIAKEHSSADGPDAYAPPRIKY
jgi:hypothetical protein